ncbi:hypothetical protein QNH47_12035 [Virgibacillus halodenitrificans]|uniref:hypothetical protein n=1 Tax=Virgibacillus halodenitrificans TaxID=1482 RepID=UPI0024C0A3D4|nr:hypothetical protein [Virgibacillus halodenitrificans]WHX24913.1 hypothetical protein QNH47_12035 [Virgibacillus halodenitrificans]
MNLGKTLVKELNLDPGVDTLGRWMAHYIAEQIETAEKSDGTLKAKAEQRCFETILKLWEHRASMPNGVRPFESFEPIFNVLKKLDPENRQPYYYNKNEKTLEPENINLNEKDLEKLLELAEGIDKVVRVWLEYILEQAALCANNEQTKEWLENSIAVKDNDEFSIIFRLLPEDIWEEDKSDKERMRDSINFRIKQLEAFNEFNHNLLLIYKKELEDV